MDLIRIVLEERMGVLMRHRVCMDLESSCLQAGTTCRQRRRANVVICYQTWFLSVQRSVSLDTRMSCSVVVFLTVGSKTRFLVQTNNLLCKPNQRSRER